MAVTRVNTTAIIKTASSGSAVTVAVPSGTGIQAGDLIVACCVSNGTHVASGTTVSDATNNTNYTALFETDQTNASSFWQESKWYVTPQAIPDGTNFTFTPFASATAAAVAIDIFRGCAGTIDQPAVGPTNSSSGTTLTGPALGGAPVSGALVISLATGEGATSLTVASPFTAGSVETLVRCCGVGYVLSADGASTYAVNWTQGHTGSWAAQAVSFTPAAAAAAGVPKVTSQYTGMI